MWGGTDRDGRVRCRSMSLPSHMPALHRLCRPQSIPGRPCSLQSIMQYRDPIRRSSLVHAVSSAPPVPPARLNLPCQMHCKGQISHSSPCSITISDPDEALCAHVRAYRIRVRAKPPPPAPTARRPVPPPRRPTGILTSRRGGEEWKTRAGGRNSLALPLNSGIAV